MAALLFIKTKIETENTIFSTRMIAVLLIVALCCSRQRYVLGDSAMHQMAKSSVFLSGLGGVGVEIGEFQSVSPLP